MLRFYVTSQFNVFFASTYLNQELITEEHKNSDIAENKIPV